MLSVKKLFTKILTNLKTISDSIGLNEIYGTGTVTNANNAERFKWYYVFTSASNVPERGILFTYGESGSYNQVLFGDKNVYIRGYHNNAWTAWYKCSGGGSLKASIFKAFSHRKVVGAC